MDRELKQIAITPVQAYLTWLNEFLTIACFAEYVGLNESKALELIEQGRREFNNVVN